MAAYMSALTYAQAKTRVARALGGQGDAAFLLIAGDAIGHAINELNGHNWNWALELASVVTVVAGTQDYALPTDFKQFYDARLNTTSRELAYIDLREYDRARWNQTSSSTPLAYTLLSYGSPRLTYIRLLPTPAAADALYIKYYRKIATPSSDSDTLDIPQIYENLVIWQAKAYLLADRDAENARTGFWMRKAQEEFEKKRADDDKVPDRDDRLIPAWEHGRPLYDPTHPYFYLENAAD